MLTIHEYHKQRHTQAASIILIGSSASEISSILLFAVLESGLYFPLSPSLSALPNPSYLPPLYAPPL